MISSYTATCPSELVPHLAKELNDLGATEVENQYKAISFQADLSTAYKIHLQSRLASRFLRLVKRFPVLDPDKLRQRVQKIRWENHINPNATYKIKVTNSCKEQAGTPPFLLEKMIREGINRAFELKGITPPRTDLSDPKIGVHLFISPTEMLLYLDTTGKSLHKRGYRVSGHPAPLKETLAAGVLRILNYEGDTTFLDPLCGSGTLAIEAATIALRKAPQIHRKKGQFGIEWLTDFDNKLWRTTFEDARLAKKQELTYPVMASDIEPRFVKICKDSALKARVEKYLQIETRSVLELPAPTPTGLLVANLPYGSRLSEKADLKEFYKSIGDRLKQNFHGWRAAFLAAKDSPYKHIGLKPSAKIDLLNGHIPCTLVIFDLYRGSKRKPLKSAESDSSSE